MASVLVTGGLGFIGKRVVEKLCEQGFAIRILDDLSSGSLEGMPPSCTFMEGDVRDFHAVRRAVRDVDYIVHLAARVSVAESIENPQLYHEVNALGTLNILRAAIEAKVKRVVYSSTTAVYGDPAGIPTTENCPLRPLSPYGASKAAGELY